LFISTDEVLWHIFEHKRLIPSTACHPWFCIASD